MLVNTLFTEPIVHYLPSSVYGTMDQ